MFNQERVSKQLNALNSLVEGFIKKWDVRLFASVALWSSKRICHQILHLTGEIDRQRFFCVGIQNKSLMKHRPALKIEICYILYIMWYSLLLFSSNFEILFSKRLNIKVINRVGHVTKFLLIFRNNSRPHENRYTFKILEKCLYC